jgi:hypothetical protein
VFRIKGVPHKGVPANFCTKGGLELLKRVLQVTGQQWRTQEFFLGGRVQKIQLRTEDRERGSGGGSPLVRGSGGRCNLVQEISFRIVNFS